MKGRSKGSSGYRPYLKPGCWRVTDDLSGFQKSSDQVKMTWDGFLATPGEGWYKRQPQDFPLLSRGITSVLNARPVYAVDVDSAFNYHVAGTDTSDFLTFQDGSLIEFKFYASEYIGNPA